jgi:hypothetical protein
MERFHLSRRIKATASATPIATTVQGITDSGIVVGARTFGSDSIIKNKINTRTGVSTMHGMSIRVTSRTRTTGGSKGISISNSKLINTMDDERRGDVMTLVIHSSSTAITEGYPRQIIINRNEISFTTRILRINISDNNDLKNAARQLLEVSMAAIIIGIDHRHPRRLDPIHPAAFIDHHRLIQGDLVRHRKAIPGLLLLLSRIWQK